MNICEACHRNDSTLYALMHRAEKRGYDAAHKEERRLRDAARRQRVSATEQTNHLSQRSRHFLRLLGGKPQCGVYVIQLESALHTFKIGSSVCAVSRLAGLQRELGPFRVCLLLPHPSPRVLERALHQRFEEMRIYKKASPTELFRFDTRGKQRQLEALYAQFPAAQVEPLVWTSPTTPVASSAHGIQGELFT